MIKAGDIILVLSYKDVNGQIVSAHPLVVVNTKGGEIEGLDFDLIGCFASSFKSASHKSSSLKYDYNIAVTPADGVAKEGVIKANVIHYFKQNKINFVHLGELSEDVYNTLMDAIMRLSDEGKLSTNKNNL